MADNNSDSIGAQSLGAIPGSRERGQEVVPALTGFDPARRVVGEVLRPESCDAEIANMMERLSGLQTWLTMQCCQRSGDPEYRSAMGLIQDVRVLIVERCFK